MSSFKITVASTAAVVLALSLPSCSSSKKAGTTSRSDGTRSVVLSNVPTPGTSLTGLPTTATTSASAQSLSGKWIGSYSGAYTGTFTLNWTQTGSQLSGTIDLSSTGMSQLNGIVSGSHISFGTVGSTVITYTGSVSGSSMSGNWSIAGGAGGTGSWSAHR